MSSAAVVIGALRVKSTENFFWYARRYSVDTNEAAHNQPQQLALQFAP